MVSIATSGADTLDQYIAKLQALREKHGGKCLVMTNGSDYPEGAHSPQYVTKDIADSYLPEGCIVLD